MMDLEKYHEWLNKINTRKGKPSPNKGKKLSKETIEKISKSKKGVSNKKLKGKKFSEEHVQNLRSSHLGKKQSKETIEKRRQKHLGRKNSEETKRKMSLASKGKPKKYDVWNKNKTKLNITPEIINKTKKLKSEGLLQKEIAEKMNYSVSTVARMLNGFYDNIEQISRGKS